MPIKISLFVAFYLCAISSLYAQEWNQSIIGSTYPKQSIEQSIYKTHIRIRYDRFWASGITINLFSTDGINYAGTLTTITNWFKDTTIDMVIKQTFDKEYAYTRSLDKHPAQKLRCIC